MSSETILSGIYSSFDRLWFHYMGYNIQCKQPMIVKIADFDTLSSLMFQELNWLPVVNSLIYDKAVSDFQA